MAEPIVVGFLNVMEGYSGGEVVLERLMAGLDRKRFIPILFTRPGRLAERAAQKGIKVYKISRPFQMLGRRGVIAALRVPWLFGYAFLLTRAMQAAGCQVVHSNSLISSIYFAPWVKLFGMRLVAHNHLIRRGRHYRLIYRYVALFADAIVCVSEAVADNWREAGIDAAKLHVVYNGVPDGFCRYRG